jgi:hypothetical protein
MSRSKQSVCYTDQSISAVQKVQLIQRRMKTNLKIQVVLRSKHTLSRLQTTIQFMLCRHIIDTCSEVRNNYRTTLCGQNVEFLIVIPEGTLGNHWVFKEAVTKSQHKTDV